MGYLRWYADNMWLFVPIQGKLRSLLLNDPAVSVPGRIEPLGRRNQLQLAQGHEGDGDAEGVGTAVPNESVGILDIAAGPATSWRGQP